MRGVGTDIVEIERFVPLLVKEKFLNRVYTAAEQAHLLAAPLPAQTAAGIFCAKEAVAKALGSGFGAALHFRDIQIAHTPTGAPFATVARRENLAISLSISHCRHYATAVAVIWEVNL